MKGKWKKLFTSIMALILALIMIISVVLPAVGM